MKQRCVPREQPQNQRRKNLKIAVTGGGTGGHIYPALEVARELRDRGCEVIFVGSLRGPERLRAGEAGFEFHGLPALPLLSLKTPAGWRALGASVRSTVMARTLLGKLGVERVFGTGGYGAAPLVAAARGKRVPYALHESNSIPGRANRMFAANAMVVTCVFHRTLKELPKAVRTGQPIRRELREAAEFRSATSGTHSSNLVLVTGGSQGSAFLNGIAPRSAELLKGSRWIHATGPTHLESVLSHPLPDGYKAVGYLETEAISEAYREAAVAVGRSGGTLAEYALFRLPSVLLPLPTSADNHQLHNAQEFAEMGAATLLEQSVASPERLTEALGGWLGESNVAKRTRAMEALAAWDIPDATRRIADLVLR